MSTKFLTYSLTNSCVHSWHAVHSTGTFFFYLKKKRKKERKKRNTTTQSSRPDRGGAHVMCALLLQHLLLLFFFFFNYYLLYMSIMPLLTLELTFLSVQVQASRDSIINIIWSLNILTFFIVNL